MSQYTLPLPHTPVYTEANFLVSPCNQTAWAMLNQWPNWPTHALVIAGSPGSGKSHLSHLWAARANAAIIPASALTTEAPTAQNWLVEDIEHLQNPRALFHLYNHTKETGHSLLMSSTLPPAQLPLTLPDLASRLRATPLAIIDHADDAVLAAAMRKQFADRQLKVEEDVIAYLLPRMERSLTHIQNIVQTIDEAAMRDRRNITVPYVRTLLEKD